MSLVWINCFRRLKLEAQDAAKEEREKTIRERKELKLNRKEKLPVKSPNRKVSFNSIIRVKVFTLKYGFHNKSFILNAPLVSCPIPVIHSGWMQQQTHPKRMTEIGQLTRGA